MKSYNVEAFVLRLRPLGEADRILTLFSKERGKLHAVAKGSRKPQSKFGARLDFFNRVSLSLHAGRSIDVLTGAHSIITGPPVWERLVEPETFALASYVAEVIDALSEPDLAVPDIFDLLVELQTAIAQGLDPAVLAPAIDLQLLAALGLGVEMDSCARCGSPLGERPLAGGRCQLSPASGGLVCHRCSVESVPLGSGTHTDELLRASSAELRALRSLRRTPLRALAALPQIAGLRRFTRPFVEYQLGRRSRALSVSDAHRRGARRSGAAS